jgi:uncharacterized protein (TIGR02145 family)
MKRVIFIFFLFPIIYSCSKTESTPAVTPPVVIKLSSCDSIKQGLLKTTSDTIRLVSCLTITNCDSIRLGILKPNTQDTLRLLSCIKITGCDSVRLGVLKPNTQDTLRLLSCIKISGCDSVRLGLLKSTKDLLRLGCNSVTIGTQKWMIVNLDIETYRNGDIIPQVTDVKTWGESFTSKTGAWCYFNFDPANGVIYGKLYNWYAVNDPRGLAPQGWHIPTDDEWTTLGNFLGGNEVAGGKMKTTGITLWNTPNIGATNQSGFAGLPGGTLSFQSGSSANTLGQVGYWWSATEASPGFDITKAWTRAVNYNSEKLFRNYDSKINGISVRCLKD